MGTYVRRFEDIHRAIERIPESGRLFCFFAIDDRSSHKQFFDLLESSADWLDHLSATSGLFTFIPISKWSQVKNPPGFMFLEKMMTFEESSFLSTFEEQEGYTNPSLLLAKKFGIKPRDLPGLIIFKALPENPPKNPFFIPLDFKSLLDNPQQFEAIMSELFSRVQEAWQTSVDANEIFQLLQQTLSQIAIEVKPLASSGQTFQHLFGEAVAKVGVEYQATKDFSYLRHEECQNVRLFISYAREDVEAATFLYRRFKEAGFQPWLDQFDILPGENWDSAIRRALRESDFFIACLSNYSVQKRGYIQREFRFALDQWNERLEEDIYLIPIRLDQCEVPEALSKFQWIDLYLLRERTLYRESRPAFKAEWDRIMQAITEGVRRRSK